MGDEPLPIFESYAEFFAALLVITVGVLLLVWLLLWNPTPTSRDYCPQGQVLITTPDGVGRCSR